MTSSDFARIALLFEELHRLTPAEREKALRTRCSEASEREEVRSLLDAHDRAGRRLELVLGGLYTDYARRAARGVVDEETRSGEDPLEDPPRRSTR